MKRLIKKSNHVEPTIHMEVEDKIIHPDVNINETQSPAFLLMKQLFADTAFVSTNTVGYQFARKIENGDYEHISSIELARDHWEEWVQALHEFLEEVNHKGIKSASKKKTK